MDNSNKIIAPHLNSEVYRSDTTGTNTLPNLDHLHIHSDGTVLVGCSELTGRYWNGGASIYKSAAEAEQLASESKKHNINLASGTSDGCFLDDSCKVLLCEDSGNISVWTKNNDAWKTWNEEISVAEHDDAVMAVDCLDPGKEYVTVGADGHIKVWDISNMICIRNYNSAHSMTINAVAVKPKSQSTFVTASLDEYVSMWDDNIAKPVIDVVKNYCGVRCVKWVDENQLVYGDEAGVLRGLDVRNPKKKLKLMSFPAAVNRLAVHPDSSKVAVSCDNKIVIVCDITDMDSCKVIYSDHDMHSNYVRDVAWDVMNKNNIVTVGWDGKIKTHENVWI